MASHNANARAALVEAQQTEDHDYAVECLLAAIVYAVLAVAEEVDS